MATIEERVSTLEAEMRALSADIHGPPWEGSLREKGHSIVTRVNALEAAGQILVEAQRERRKALAERDTNVRRKRSEWWKFIAAVSALLAVVAPYIVHFA
jgi:hypothetical protein